MILTNSLTKTAGVSPQVYFSGIDQSMTDKRTENWLDTIEDRLAYQRWYCGHWHINKHIDRMHLLFGDVEEFAVGLTHET